MIEILKVILLGIVEGITEWLPVSSTGHMILVDEFLQLNVSKDFMEMFLVVIQLGAILAVVYLYWDRLFPFKFKGGFQVDRSVITVWFKIIVASIPAIMIGLPFDDFIEATFFNPWVVAAMLILYGVIFIVVERRNGHRQPTTTSLADLSYKTAFIIGWFQVLAMIPGTSRSGATIIGGMLIGTSRTVAADFTFFMAIPVMFGASLLKLIGFGFAFTAMELTLLVVGMVVAFITSILAIKFLLGYIKKHDFTVFGWYRIVLGVIVLGYFILQSALS